MPDRSGAIQEVTLNYQKDASLFLSNTKYYGSTIGRSSNRIAEGRFSLEGKEYSLAVNNGPNNLHGGIVGWSHKVTRYLKSVGVYILFCGS